MTSPSRALSFTQRAASAMPGGKDEIGESGRAHSAKTPVRRHEAAARKSGVAISRASPAKKNGRRHARAIERKTSCAKTSERAAATSAKRAIGRKSASTEVRKVK